MKLSTVLLSSAALLVAGAAYAADLPAKKAAPAAAPTGCASFGAGYIAIPGGDTCLKISGYVRSDNTFTSNVTRPTTSSSSFAGYYGLDVASKNNSEAGVVGSEIFIENNTTTVAGVSLGGLKAGQLGHLLDIGLGYNYTGSAFGAHLGQIQYSMPLGASTLSVAVTSAADNATTGGTIVASRPDIDLALSTSVGALKTTVGVVSHEAMGTTSGSAQGFAFIGSASYDAGVAKISGYAAYENAAAAYVGAGYSSTASANNHTYYVFDADATASSLSSGYLYQGQIDVPVGKNDSIGVFGETASATTTTSSYTRTQYAVALTHTMAPGLKLVPELYQNTSNGTITNGAYIRIERDF